MGGGSSGNPHLLQIGSAMRANDARHFSQIGKREAPVSSSSQSRHPAGRKMLTSAPRTSASQAGMLRAFDEEALAAGFPTAKAYPFLKNNQ